MATENTARTMRTRIGVVALGLVTAGAVVGAVCAFMAINLALIAENARDGSFVIDRPVLVTGAAMLGAASGAILAPLAGFVLLRAVPLGRAVLWCMIATLLGATVGHMAWGFNPYDADQTPGIIRGAILGFLSASAILWFTHRHRSVPSEIPEQAI